MTFKQLERILLKNGWIYKETKSSHYQYIHQIKKGKVTIPRHREDLDIRTANSNLKQARLK